MPNLKNKNILITGATGFIGKSLILELTKSGHQVMEVSSKGGRISNNKI